MELIEVTASCEKSEIASIGKLKGTSNRLEVAIEGVQYEPGTLIFRGFVGLCDLDSKPRRWVGVYRFEPIPEGVVPPEVGDWSILNNDPVPKTKPNTKQRKAPDKKESEVADGA